MIENQVEDYKDLCIYIEEYSKRISCNNEMTMSQPIDRLNGVTRNAEHLNSKIDF